MAKTRGKKQRSAEDPLWYKNAVIYELHVRAFSDSSGDGVGDFQGLTARLDYLQDLGVTAIWLLPFYPSPLKDDGYDIADYTGVNPAYGSLRDAKRFVAEAHRRGMRVITELVLNHTSDQHPWFQRSRRSPPGSVWRDFYVWSDTADKYAGTRIIFQDFETSNWTWDPVAKQYYWHRFYSHQPDLNFDNPAVHRALEQVVDLWFSAGVDGMRLDAVPYLYEREGTNCENLPETHAYLKKLRRHVEERYPGAMLLAEANQWPEDSIAYFGDGDECHMAFHFPLMPRLFMAIRMEDRFPVIDILQQTPPIPETCQWALFLRNHDELTLEMVTDEERDYMYRVYASDRQARINLGIRRRLAPLLGNNRRKIELMNGLLFSLPGTPVIYYGDELGMGDNVYLGDRDAVRTPMQWSADRNAGFSRANPQRLFLPVIIDPEYHFETVNVEAQQNNPHSLLWWMKRLISLRKNHPVFGHGDLEFLSPTNGKVLAYLRRTPDETILVVANLSRFVQCTELDLSAFKDHRPVEMFGGTRFPPVGELPYFLTLGPHSFYWFMLKPGAAAVAVAEGDRPRELPVIPSGDDWERALATKATRSALESVLADDLPQRRWFGAKARTIRSVRITDVVPIKTAAPTEELSASFVLIRVEYTEGEAEAYAIPLALASQTHASHVLGSGPSAALVAHVRSDRRAEPRILYDAMVDQAFCSALYDLVARRRRVRGAQGEILGQPARAMRKAPPVAELGVTVPGADQSNSSVLFGDRFIMKVYRRVEAGANPDPEISSALTDLAAFPHTPPLAGTIEYDGEGSEPLTLAMIQGFVPNQGDAWRYTLDQLGQYYERVLSLRVPGSDAAPPPVEGSLIDLAAQEPPEQASELIGPYLHSVELLAQRTAELHLALSRIDDPAFTPEPFTQLYQRSLYQSMRNSARRSIQLLRRRAADVPEELRSELDRVLHGEQGLLDRLGAVSKRKITAVRTRHHGDYHLGQVLYTGKDFVIIDFEGEPSRSLGERRLKRSPLRDVAGMLRSFDYAVHAALLQQVDRGVLPAGDESLQALEPWAQYWRRWTAAAFLRGYLAAADGAPFVPPTTDELRVLLEAYLLEKALYELAYELNNRPKWVRIPLLGIIHLIGPES